MELIGAAGGFNALKKFAGDKLIVFFSGESECSREVDFNPAAMCDLRRGHGCAVNGNRCDIAETNAVSGDGESNLVELGCGRFNRAGECNVVELDAVIAAVYTAVLAVGPFKGVCAVGSCGVGLGCPCTVGVAGELLNFGAVCFEAVPVIVAFTAVEIVEGEGIACGHLNSC